MWSEELGGITRDISATLAALILLTFASSSWGGPELTSLFAPAQERPAAGKDTGSAILVELFTSEGCSSCPPADTLLRQINGTRTAKGQLVVGISEHVTYWNGLGWSDPFSAETYTKRQNAYGARFNLDSVYTPQMVINGSTQIVGGDRSGLEQAFLQESGRPQMALHIVSASVEDSSSETDSLQITFSYGNSPEKGQVDVLAALTDDLDRSVVPRGENSGRTLTHVSVARALMHLTTVGAAGQTTVRVPLPAGFQLSHNGHHLVLFAQAAHFGRVVGIDTRSI